MASRKSKYHKYLESSEWQEFRKRYFASDMPKHCLACCGSERITLHHLTYARVGKELLTDVVPLCFSCHDRLHRYAPMRGFGNARDFLTSLSRVFKIDKATARERMSAWSMETDRPSSLRELFPKSGKKEKVLAKRLKKRLGAMSRDAKYHARMCKR